MSQNVDFDVVIPAHNAAASIVAAVQSAQQQSYPAKAIIVVADACSDDTAKRARDAGAQVVEIDARSVSVARNTGVAGGLSPWIAFLDADDLWYPGWLQSVQQSMKPTADSALYYGQIIVRHPDGQRLARPETHVEDPHKALPVLLTHNFVTTSACVLSRQIFLKNGGFDSRYSHAEDWDLWLRVAEQYTLQQVPAWQVEYRLSPLSAMRDPQLFHTARQQSLKICQRSLKRSGVQDSLKNHALAYVYKMSAERFLQHNFVSQARQDLQQAIKLTPRDKDLWAMALLSTLHPNDRGRLLGLRRVLRGYLQKFAE